MREVAEQAPELTTDMLFVFAILVVASMLTKMITNNAVAVVLVIPYFWPF